MPSAFMRNGRVTIKFRDHLGIWRTKATTCRTKTEGRRLAEDLERKAERQRLGLEQLPGQSSMTVTELVRWWLKHHCPETSQEIEGQRLEKHICSKPIGALPLHEAATEIFEEHLKSLTELGPGSVNKVRSMVHSAFEWARRRKRWTGVNPLADIEPLHVPKKKYGTLAAEEVPMVLPHIPEDWRDFFAVALWTAMRKGELAGLLKADVDLENRTIFVGRSYGRSTTKGQHEDHLPIADPVLPILRAAMARSGSEYVLPDPDGKMRDPGTKPQAILRTALRAAGLIQGYEHVCRWCEGERWKRSLEHRAWSQAKTRKDRSMWRKRYRKSAPKPERHPDRAPRDCPVCHRRLWPKAIPRNMRFHDLRHTVITLLLRAGVPAHVVQKIARHADIRTTLGTYGHLMVDDLRSAVSTLPPMPERMRAVQGQEIRPVAFGTSLVPGPAEGSAEVPGGGGFSSNSEELEDGRSRDRTYDSCRVKPLIPSDSWSEIRPLGERRRNHDSRDHNFSQVSTSFPAQFGASVVQTQLRVLGGGAGNLLTVRQVAEKLSVSTELVYRMIKQGTLPHVRLNSNAVRVRPEDLAVLTEPPP